MHPPALEAWLAAHGPAALVLDARAVRLSAAPHLYDLTAARGVELVVAAIYDGDDPRQSASAPVGRRVSVEDIVRGVRSAIGVSEDAHGRRS
jgi:hypothetical protein